MAKNRFPTVKRASDEFEIDVAGEKLRPHEGESVHFIPYLSVRKALILGNALSTLGSEDEETSVSESFRVIGEISEILVGIIDHWDWTHPITGEAVGKEIKGERKPSTEDIQELSINEVTYLINEFFGAMSPEENPPPASSE
jgi:hypothetical protein